MPWLWKEARVMKAIKILTVTGIALVVLGCVCSALVRSAVSWELTNQVSFVLSLSLSWSLSLSLSLPLFLSHARNNQQNHALRNSRCASFALTNTLYLWHTRHLSGDDLNTFMEHHHSRWSTHNILAF